MALRWRRVWALACALGASLLVGFAGSAAADPIVSSYTVPYGQPVVMTVDLPADSTGTVTFTRAGSVVCDAVPVSGGAAQCTVSGLAVGTYSFESDYSGDSAYQPSSAQVTVDVTPAPVGGFVENGVVPTDGGPELLVGASATLSATGIPADDNGAVTFVDGGSGCLPRTCLAQGFNCGPAGDGCGNQLSCGSCKAGLSCGGGGIRGIPDCDGGGGMRVFPCKPNKTNGERKGD